tara:strand:- start:218 stop:928 length:711 start_codon:yes stop_codon:yes gene_type:complete
MINKEKISILILVCNEIKTIEKDIISIKKNLKNFIDYQLVVIQDGSTDGTYERLKFFKKKYNLTLNSVKKRRGYTNAFLTGIKSCRNDTIFFSDTGKKYDFKNLRKFIDTFFKKKTDLLSGYRIKRKDKIFRRILTFFYTKSINLLFNKKYKDYDCGFKVFRKTCIKKIVNKQNFTPYLFTSQIFIYFFKYNYKIIQLPIEYLENKKRSSRGIPTTKIPKIVILSLMNLLKIRSKF